MKLNQVIAIEKSTKAKSQHDVDEVYKLAQKPSLFDGFVKTYLKKDENDDDVPPQIQNVQASASSMLRQIADRWIPLFDVTATKDFSNCHALADIVGPGGTPIMKDVPVTYLLFLEKQLTDLYTIISKFPTLDPAERWAPDPNTGHYITEPTLTTRTKKVQRGLVLHGPTKEHPAQTQLITEDVSVGKWQHTKFSGALPEPEKQRLLRRIEELQIAVKTAREEANMTQADEMAVGKAIFNQSSGRRSRPNQTEPRSASTSSSMR